MKPMKKLQQMKKMEEILCHVMKNLNTVTLKSTAEAFGYNEAYLARIFKEYFEYPFHKYVMKLRLRGAAREIYDTGGVGNVGSETGYRYLPGFSQAFKKEFGISPRAFLKERRQVPDMPLLSRLDGVAFELRYEVLPDLNISSHVIYPVMGNEADLMEDAAYGLLAGYGYRKKERYYGIWDNDADGKRVYLMGVEKRAQNSDSNRRFYQPVYPTGVEEKTGEEPFKERSYFIPKGQYAVFRIPVAESREKTLARQRMLVRYVFKEWLLINRKVTNRMGVTYEYFDREWTGLCVPLIKGMNGYETVTEEKWSGDFWIEYINEHIRENLTTERLASFFNYSETIFRTTFFSKYGMTAADYILKRRLILAAEEIEQGKGRADRIARKYGFSSLERLKELFYQNFDVRSEEVHNIDFSVIDLPEYYESNRQRFRITAVKLEDFYVEGYHIRSIQEENVYDIHEVTSYWFRYYQKEKEDAVYALWDRLPQDSQEKENYGYFIGRQSTSGRKRSSLDRNHRLIHVSGGSFVVFETSDERDDDNLREKYAMLERCAFYRWIRENRIRYDEKRITFAACKNHKLYFYVPVIK